MPQNVLIYTDPFNDVDDIVAIYAAAKSTNLRLTVIVTTDDDARAKAKSVKKFLELTGFDHVPVTYGKGKIRSSYPLFHMRETEYEFLSPGDLAATDTISGITGEGVNFMAKQIGSQPDLCLMSLAPLTDAAKAFAHSDPKKLKAVYIMGGHVGSYSEEPRPPYNMAKVAEYNFESDPVPAKKVLESGANIFIVGKNICLRFSDTDVQRFANGPKAQQELYRMMQSRHEHNKNILEPRGITAERFMYDPAAVASLLYPELFDFRTMEIEIDGNGITHTRLTETGKIHGAVDADLERVRTNLLELMLSG